MIYLTRYATSFTKDTTLISDIPYPQHAHLMDDTYRRAKTGLSYPPHKMANTVLDLSIIAYVKDNPVPGKTAFILAAGSQSWAGRTDRYDHDPDTSLYYRCKIPFLTLTNIYAGRIASMFGGVDHISTDATACASSLKVMMDVQNLMNNFGFDRVIVLSVEDSVCNTTLEFFGEAGASLQYKDEDDTRPSAFDSVNRGFFIGQGAVLAVFEHEYQDMAEPVAKLLGAYTAAEDNANPLGQRDDGAGYSAAIEGALFIAKIDKDVVKLVKTHGTGTPVNNVAERAALQRSLNEFIATSYKQCIGHTLASSGLLETCILLEDMDNNIIPAIPNRTEDDDVFLSADSFVPDGPFLSLAAGMGNVYSAALFARA